MRPNSTANSNKNPDELSMRVVSLCPVHSFSCHATWKFDQKCKAVQMKVTIRYILSLHMCAIKMPKTQTKSLLLSHFEWKNANWIFLFFQRAFRGISGNPWGHKNNAVEKIPGKNWSPPHTAHCIWIFAPKIMEYETLNFRAKNQRVNLSRKSDIIFLIIEP